MAVKSDTLNSIIGEGTFFEGRFYIDGSIRVDGKFKGDLETTEDIVVGESGKVYTNIKAKRALVSGMVIGDIVAEEEVRLSSSGRILGNMLAPNLQMQNGVVFKGNIMITGNEDVVNLEKKMLSQFEGGHVVEMDTAK